MTPEERKQLEGLKNTAFWQLLKRYLDAEYADLKDITHAKDEVDMRGRQHAVKILDKLFSFMEPRKTKKKSVTPYI